MPSLALSGVPAHGIYVVAASGGVDSSVLLYLLKRQHPGLHVVVAHVEHGIRGVNSKRDAAFVRNLAAHLGYSFELLEAKLGSAASEEAARKSRYAFLRQVCNTYGARGIMTAHHQDDVLETICLNVMRGTGWRGLCSLRSTPQLLRPLLNHSKSDILAYATSQQIEWRHDHSNDSDAYVRNRLRHHVVPRLSESARSKLLHLWQQQCDLRQHIEQLAAETYRQAVIFEHDGWTELSRYHLVMLPRPVAYEILRLASLKTGGRSLLHGQMEHLLIFVATARPGSRMSPGAGLHCRATRRGVVVGK